MASIVDSNVNGVVVLTAISFKNWGNYRSFHRSLLLFYIRSDTRDNVRIWVAKEETYRQRPLAFFTIRRTRDCFTAGKIFVGAVRGSSFGVTAGIFLVGAVRGSCMVSSYNFISDTTSAVIPISVKNFSHSEACIEMW